jgi:hypothetical protein
VYGQQGRHHQGTDQVGYGEQRAADLIGNQVPSAARTRSRISGRDT